MTKGYNERLFSGRGIRSYLHNARFIWFERTLRQIAAPASTVIEIGCFDGRLLEYFPQPPELYRGFDAGWEGGLKSAQRKFRGNQHWTFDLAQNASALAKYPDGFFELGASMETIEHIPPELVDDYLRELARVVNGTVLVTVPNEKGFVFLVKWIVKRFFLSSAETYSLSELVAATLGKLDKVERNEHKGFDYDVLVKQMSKYMKIEKVESIPLSRFPLALSFTVGIIATAQGVHSDICQRDAEL